MKMTLNTDPVCMPYKSNTIAEAKAHTNLGPPPENPPWGVSTPWQFGVDGKPFKPTVPTEFKYVALAAAAAALAVGVVVGKKM